MTDLVTNVQDLDFDSLSKESGIFGIFQKAGAKIKNSSPSMKSSRSR